MRKHFGSTADPRQSPAGGAHMEAPGWPSAPTGSSTVRRPASCRRGHARGRMCRVSISPVGGGSGTRHGRTMTTASRPPTSRIPRRDSLPVPSHWQLQGFGKPAYTNIRYPFPVDPPRVPDENPTGDYRVSFGLPDHWASGRVTLRFEGLDSCGRVWVNGNLIGTVSAAGSRRSSISAPPCIEPFSSCDLVGLKDVDGFGDLPGSPGAAAEFAQDPPGLELGVRALAGAA